MGDVIKRTVIVVCRPTTERLSMKTNSSGGGVGTSAPSYDVFINGMRKYSSTDIKKVILLLLGLGFTVPQVADNLGLDDAYVEQVNNQYEAEERQKMLDNFEFEHSPHHNTEYVTATVYHAVPEQTDRSPMITADGTDVSGMDLSDARIIAVSRDLLKRNGGHYNFGDRVVVNGAGEMDGVWTIRDTMNDRFTKKIDFLVPEYIKGGKWENVSITPLS